MDGWTLLLGLILVIAAALLLAKFRAPLMHLLKSGGGQRRLSIITQEPWFGEIKAGRKTVEARVGPPTLYEDNIGEMVDVVVPKGEKLIAKITAVRHYATLDEYISAETVKKIAPHTASAAAAATAYLAIKNKAGDTVYDPARVTAKGGITAIELKLA